MHDVSQDVRERSTREREQTARDRDRTASARLSVADERDSSADDRDRVALERDRRADERTRAMARFDAASAREDQERALTGADVLTRAAGHHKRAAQRRALAAQQRELAAQDRGAAAQDRAQAARERREAMEDRELLADELQHEKALLQREKALRVEALAHQHRAEKLARTLQRSLSPPRLPAIAGLDVAVHYEPSAPEEVGGDFYDLFPLSGTRTGLFLGDVCGKGPDAAAVTSLARYTMRTAAMLRETPDAILIDLNAALLMESAKSMQTCTVVYGQLDMSDAAAAITLAVAGHPPPLVVRAGGAVENTPAHGTMLGAVTDPAFVTCQVSLEPGDAIVICSDGILDTEIDGDRVDEQRVSQLLCGPQHASAQMLVDRLLHGLRSSLRPLRDDIAIMVLRRTPL
ncbi:MAG: PP2C family protein-serine/threonine phosphatase [Solirubrobacteraceae bacterium]